MSEPVQDEGKRRVIGRPFAAGPDSRRGPGARKKDQTARLLARAERSGNIAALVRLRDQTDDLELALEACKLLLRYSDGEPGMQNVPTDLEEARAAGAAAEDDDAGDVGPPQISGATEAA